MKSGTSTIRQWIGNGRSRLRQDLRRSTRRRHEFQIDGRTFHQPTFRQPTTAAPCCMSMIASPAERNRRPPVEVDDGPQRRAVQHRGLRGRRPVPQPGSPRRGSDAPRRPRPIRAWKHDQVGDRRPAKRESWTDIRARGFDAIRPGNALMYYPEANVLGGSRQRRPRAARRPPSKAWW